MRLHQKEKSVFPTFHETDELKLSRSCDRVDASSQLSKNVILAFFAILYCALVHAEETPVERPVDAGDHSTSRRRHIYA